MAKIPNSFKIIGGIAAVVAGAAAGTFFYLKKNKATVLKDGCFVYKFDDLNAAQDGEDALDGETADEAEETAEETAEEAAEETAETVEEAVEEGAQEQPEKPAKKLRSRKKKAE